MDTITIALGSGMCRIVQPVVGSMPQCYNASHLSAIGWLGIVLLVVLGFGWKVTRRA